jgi:hypothetical protein
VYQADPDAPPDADFAPGELRWLVPGNRGRLMDGRRTPIRVTAIDLDHGWFGVEILAFEDTGARWLVPLEEVVRYQFEPDGENARAAQIAAMAAAIRRFDVPAEIIADPAAGRRSRDRIARHRAAADEWLTSQGVPARIDPEPFIQSRQGSPDAPAWLAGYLTATGSGLAALDEQLAAAYVSNPNSGDLIRAHLIVLAELGLSDYRGKSLRDEAALAGRLNRAARTGHIVARAGFVQALWARADRPGLMLYRGIGLPGPAGGAHGFPHLRDVRPPGGREPFQRPDVRGGRPAALPAAGRPAVHDVPGDPGT